MVGAPSGPTTLSVMGQRWPFLPNAGKTDETGGSAQARFVSGNRSRSSRSTDSEGIGGPKR